MAPPSGLFARAFLAELPPDPIDAVIRDTPLEQRAAALIRQSAKADFVAARP
jgi:hypothetical protein